MHAAALASACVRGGFRGGGGGDPGGHRTYSDFIQAWRIEKHESGSSFLLGGEVSEEVETLGGASPLPTSFK